MGSGWRGSGITRVIFLQLFGTDSCRQWRIQDFPYGRGRLLLNLGQKCIIWQDPSFFSLPRYISSLQVSGGSRIFPRGGREPSRGGVNTPNFPENCMKSKEFGRPGGGVRPSRPPLDPPMQVARQLQNESNILFTLKSHCCVLEVF